LIILCKIPNGCGIIHRKFGTSFYILFGHIVFDHIYTKSNSLLLNHIVKLILLSGRFCHWLSWRWEIKEWIRIPRNMLLVWRLWLCRVKRIELLLVLLSVSKTLILLSVISWGLLSLSSRIVEELWNEIIFTGITSLEVIFRKIRYFFFLFLLVWIVSIIILSLLLWRILLILLF
jgi:hypothetical protein